ncbi:hypothetical protein KSP40_PGU007521 [Platanthera guangdongensis]|uniref:Ycf15 n=1 Tax=Platanthera guangdongensis TaxID=2320717 RepID=A0ABR2MZJ0_9ASPA
MKLNPSRMTRIYYRTCLCSARTLILIAKIADGEWSKEHWWRQSLICSHQMQRFSYRMEEQFIKYGKGRVILEDDGEGNRWLPENPFEVRSDWEQHVLGRGGRMYRTMLRKVCKQICRFSL